MTSRGKFRLLYLYLLDIIIAICFITNVLYENISLDTLTRFIAAYCAIEPLIEWVIFEIQSQYKKEKKNENSN